MRKEYGDQRRAGAYVIVERYVNQLERKKKERKRSPPPQGEEPCEDPRD